MGKCRDVAFGQKTRGNCANFLRKILFSFLLFVFCIGGLGAQETCDFRAQIETRVGSCFNNCMFIYRLVDEHGVALDNLPDNLSEVRLYYMKLNESDTVYSAHYTGDEDTVFLQAGTYVVGMEGLCDLGSENRHIIRTVDTLTLTTTYHVPTAPVINQVATTVNGIGTHPTLPCDNTGRVQLKIEGGKRPFYVEVVNESGDDTLKSVVFENPMYEGDDETRYDYRYYYSIDSLPAGTWKFYVHDACHYGMAVTIETVDIVPIPMVEAIDVYASTGRLTDSNIVKIRTNMNYPYKYYIQELCNFMSYRIYKEGVPVTDDSWKPFPYTSSGQTILYDTLDIQNYCEVMNQGDSIHFQFRINMGGCKDTIVNRYFHYNKPNKTKFDYNKTTEKLDLRKVGEPCEYSYWYYTDKINIKYHSYQPDNANSGDDHEEYRYHYTSPLTWTYIDLNDERDTIKKDTIQHLGESTSLTLEEAGFSLSDLDNSPTKSEKRDVRVVLVDAHGCQLYEARQDFKYELINERVFPSCEVTNTSGNHCCEVPRSITVKTSGILKDSVIIDTVLLIQSPMGNRYNFIATFNRSILTWVTKPLTNQIQNVTAVNNLNKFGEPDGKSFSISGNCLPSGPYKFVIKTQCGSDTIIRKIKFPDVHKVYVKDPPVHNVVHECAYMYVTYSQGQFEIRKSNQDSDTGEPIAPTITPLSTWFQVVSGPAGGYNGTVKYKIGDEPLRFSLPGTYVIKMYPNINSSDICEDQMYLYDTIIHKGAILDLDYVGALKCKETDTEGDVYISGKYGTPPYTYTLYDSADLRGNLVASIKVKENGDYESLVPSTVGVVINGMGLVFGSVYGDVEGVPLQAGKELSCMIQDSCGTYFYVNFFPQTLATMQKVWFDNDQREAVICEGDSVQVHALEYGSFFSYQWTNNSGDFISSVANPYLSIPRESQEGTYYVTIFGHGCNMTVKDSIHLIIKESPSIRMQVTLDEDTIVCPGSTLSLTVTPHSHFSDTVHFSLAFSNEKGEEIRDYVGESDVPMSIEYTALYPTYIYSVLVEDDECGFHHPEDSIEIKTKNKEMLTNCSLMTRWDTVCSGSAAELYARNTVTPPYTLQWYHDYELTSLAQEDVINDPDNWSSYQTAVLTEDTVLYVRVVKENMCPSHQLIATEVHNIGNGHEHRIACKDVLRLYDTGGPHDNYSIGEEVMAYFRSGDGRPLSLHFEELDLSVTSVLYVISGTEVVDDSILCILKYGIDVPEVIVSRSDALTLYFTAGDNTASGWNALIQTAGSVAIAKVNKPVYTIFSDEVCQRHSGTYDDPYHVVGEIVPADTISKIIKQAGTYLFTKTYPRELPLCDSTVSFQLTVKHPDYNTPINVVTTTLEPNYPYVWHGETYYETGQYLHPIEGTGDDCDVIDVLNLVVLEINGFTNQLEICKGENATLAVSIITPTLPPIFTQLHRVGDVLCTDNTIMHPDSFLLSGKSAKGVVFYLDPNNNNKGKAIALRDAYEGMDGRGDFPRRFQGECMWAIGGKNSATNKEYYQSIHARRKYDKVGEAIYDMSGWGNTDTIRKTTYNLAGIDTSTATSSQMNNAFKKYAPAAYYCYYYNADSARVMKGDREKETEGGNISPIPSGWYLPSMGEINLYYANRREVSRTLEKLQNAPHNAKLMQGRIDVRQDTQQYRYDESYWTSTEYNDQEAYRLSGKGQMIYAKSKYPKSFSTNNPSFVRAIIEF